MKRIEFTIPLEPRTKKNSQQIVRSRNGQLFIKQSAKYTQYVHDTSMILRAVKGKNNIREPITEPVTVRAHFYRSSRRIVDLTNLQECLHDVLVDSGILADDSCRIIVSTDGSRVRYDKKNPRTEVMIEPVINYIDFAEREKMMP